MAVILLIAGAIWFIGPKFGMPVRVRGMLLVVLFTAVFFFQLTLPSGNPIKEATGGSIANWLILVGVVGLVLAYRFGLSWLRARSVGAEETTEARPGSFSQSELDRYARHIVLREIGGPGQKKLKSAKVLVIGAGGLGAPSLQYLAAAGVGTIGIIDDDVVENSNLQRQVIHTDARLGMPKVFSAKQALNDQNPFVEIRPYNRRLSKEIAPDLFSDYDLVLDGSDNFDTRHLVNRTCVELGIPLVAAAITQWEGQISLYHPASGGPCFACVFPNIPDAELAPSCAEAGVLGALPGVIGSMMAVEAIKWITGAGEPLTGRLLIYDALFGESRNIKALRRPDCDLCGS
ncbi:MAG: HesA/MoeB/ThiF family protein [Pseudomonadota bacterium]